MCFSFSTFIIATYVAYDLGLRPHQQPSPEPSRVDRTISYLINKISYNMTAIPVKIGLLTIRFAI